MTIILLFLVLLGVVRGDEFMTCSRPVKSSRGIREDNFCDFGGNSYCLLPGQYYPWHAVRRFVFENQGLMRRMYGEVRQLSLIRSELEENTIENSREFDDLFKPFRSLSTTSTKTPPPTQTQESTSPSPKTTTTTTPTTTSTTPSTTTTASTTTTTTTAVSEMTNTEEPVTMAMVTQMRLDIFDDDSEMTTPFTVVPETTTTIETVTELNAFIEKRNQVLYQDYAQEDPQQGVNACPVKEEVVAPYWANNTRGEVLALLNLYPFEQYIHWEKCHHENKQMFCRDGCRCEQQYRLHRLLAFDPNNECRGIFSDWFRFPSCCVCKCYMGQVKVKTGTYRSPRRHFYYQENLENH